MAKVLKDYKPPAYHGTEYPWEKWLDGQVWLLTKGEDFESTTRSFQISARRAALKRGMAISMSTYIDPDTHEKCPDSIVVRTSKLPDEPPADKKLEK